MAVHVPLAPGVRLVRPVQLAGTGAVPLPEKAVSDTAALVRVTLPVFCTVNV